MPVEGEAYDVAISQHVQMNIRDKHAYVSEIARVLKPDGRIGLYEICAGETSPVHCPVRWSRIL